MRLYFELNKIKVDNSEYLYCHAFFLQIIFALNELRGKFSPAEWLYMADSFNGTLISDDSGVRYSTAALLSHIEDSNTYDKLGSKYKVDVQALMQKCEKLTHSQLDALYCRIARFWEGGVDAQLWANF